MIVVAAAVLREAPGGAVLLTKRLAGAHLGGRWEFPGGKRERGEDPERTVVRECREELALDVEVRGVLDAVHHHYPEKEVLLLFYDCRIAGGTLEHRGVADSAWVAPEDLPSYDLPPPDARLIDALRRGG